MPHAFFVAGTDTGVGKTHVTCALLRATRQRGLTAIGMKPIAAGVGADGANDDVTRLMAASSVSAPLEWINPFLYTPAIAPHIAAREAGRPIELAPIVRAFERLRQLADVVWVEGVGGFRVPLDERYDTADLAQRLALPVVLVVGMRLGCLNHALLTMEAIAGRSLRVAGWVANRIDPAMERFAANLESLEHRLAAPLLGVVPHDARFEQAARALDVSVLPDFGDLFPNSARGRRQ
ncbi:MAG: dethiobiotin synthase [Candidatus Competibacteraceae bacterium]|nr:dethiobiotin synthase [Candidatus Competibacteraceae bacterium]MBK7984104.1 dethiobiotin synthase [Candidatus Competibacteraceae bacterium]MBK8896080.1 dethiobiotin synthase [Candidatus Competibacteraceae bacterium]MBK8963505.1 dethiobiotin synthase [Candidatus Competibacteraceae bacterium]MBK9950398.1 dethiobiotin synthase [Candidatus Competibacteraceae bacterium]